MEEKIYKFKNVNHSVLMKFIKVNQDGMYVLENKDYKGLIYVAKMNEKGELELL